MFRLFVVIIMVISSHAEDSRKPMYKYRYETEDLMKTAASSVPVHGYHVVEGGYYPYEGGFGGGLGAGGNIGGRFIGSGGGISQGGYGGEYVGGGFGQGGYNKFGGGGFGVGGAGIRHAGIGGGFGGASSYGSGIGLGAAGYGSEGGHYLGGPEYHHGGYGGEIVDKNIYSGGKKNFNDLKYEKASGKNGEEVDHGQEGYSQGKVALRNDKGEAGYYNDLEGGKKAFEDGKKYYGGQHYAQEGKNGAEKNINNGHKKGHSIKGFKTSHHKDESGKTEEYFDEENDEGKNVLFNGQAGNFGQNGASAFKGGHQDGNFNSGEHKNEGHYDNQHFIDNSNADQGRYGQKKYAGNGAVYAVNNGVDQESLLGHQESSKFYKHNPHHLPFYGGVY